MKKKIKDLTLEEFNSFCDKYNYICSDCPINENCIEIVEFIREHTMFKRRYKELFNKEIEVEEDELPIL